MWAVTIILSYIFSQVVGYFFHRLLHNPITGFMYRAHLKHHCELYPTDSDQDFLAPTYKGAGTDSLLLYALPVIIALSVVAFWVLPTLHAVLAISVMALVSIVNDVVHDKTHISGTVLEKSKRFQRFRLLHRYHHKFMGCETTRKANYGIFSFWMDKLMGTYVDKEP